MSEKHRSMTTFDHWLETTKGRWFELLLISILMPANPVALLSTGSLAGDLFPAGPGRVSLAAVWLLYRAWALRHSGALRAFGMRFLKVLLLMSIAAAATRWAFMPATEWWIGNVLRPDLPGIAGGVLYGMLIASLHLLFGLTMLLALLWGWWRWRGRDPRPFSEALRRDLLALLGWSVLAGLLQLGFAPWGWTLPGGMAAVETESGRTLQFHWVPFGNDRYGLYGHLPDDLPREDVEHGTIVKYIPVTCGNKPPARNADACHPLTLNREGIVSLQPDGLFVIPPQGIDPAVGRQPPSRFWLEVVTLGQAERGFPAAHGQRVSLLPARADLVPPRLQVLDVHLEPEQGRLRIQVHFRTPVRIGSLGLWLLPKGTGSLLEIPGDRGTIQIPGMAEWQLPLKPHLEQPPHAGREEAAWYLGNVDFLYPVDAEALRLLRRHGDRRYGRRIPARLRIRVAQFGRPPTPHQPHEASVVERQAWIQVPPEARP